MEKNNQTSITAEPGKQELFITREFAASREAVFEAFTDPEMLVQWLVHKDRKMSIDYINYKPGGSYRFLQPGPNGTSVGLSGVVHDLTPPERLIRTFEWEGLPERGHVALEKIVFEALSGERTKVTIQYMCESVAFRDGLVSSGMHSVFVASFSLLDQVLSKVSAG